MECHSHKYVSTVVAGQESASSLSHRLRLRSRSLPPSAVRQGTQAGSAGGRRSWWSALPWNAHSPSFPSLHLRHSSFSNLSLALPTSQLILQPFRRFTYVTAHSPTLLLLLLRHRIFTYVTWRAAHAFLYLHYSRPYLLPFVKHLEGGVVHNQRVHLS